MRKRWVCATLLFLLAAALWATGFVKARTLSGAYAGVSVRLIGAGVKETALRDILPTPEDDGLTLAAAWSRTLGADMTADGAAATAVLVTVYGDMRRTEPVTLLCGAFPTDGDTDGCVIDSETAVALFRSAFVTDVPVTVNGRAYVVRGVVSAYAPAVFVRHTDAAYTNLEFDAADLSTGKARAEAYLYRHALGESSVCVQSGLYAKMGFGLAFLPAAVFLLACGVRMLVLARQRRARTWATVLLYAAVAALTAGSVLVLWKTLYLPQQFLPTRAADFAFWRTLLDTWRADWRSITLLSPVPGDIMFFRGMRGLLLVSGATVVAAVAAVFAAPPLRKT